MASLTPVASCEAFVEALEKSGLLAAEELAKIRDAAAEASDPKALARDLVKAGTLTKWQAAQLLHGFYLLVVGKFKLLDQISSGETGRVYLAEHMQIQRRHALKILSRRHANKPEVLQRFLSEAQQVCALEHRNLSHVYDVNQDGDKYYLVMEYVEGQNLQQRVELAGPLTPVEAIEAIHQAADGLAHAHERKVWHGDLKPANLLVDGTGTVKITDIGQGRLFEAPAGTASTDETTEAAALSAAIYRAPELRAGGAVDGRCDVYALGSVLCYLLAGKPAADAADAAKLLAKVKSLPADLQQLCLQMLSDDPAARPAAMSEVRAALAKIGKQPMTESLAEPTAAEPATSPDATTAAPPKKKRRLVAKAINDAVEAAEAAKAAAATSETSPTTMPAAETPADPFAGFAVQTGKKSRSKDSGPTPVVTAKSIAKSATTVNTNPAASQAKSKLPLIIGGAIGGGVLLLGGIVVAVILALNGGQGAADKAVADATSAVGKAASKAKATPSDSTPEASSESNPESNPMPVAEATTPPPLVTPLAPPTTTPAPMVTPMPTPTPAVTQLPEAPMPPAIPAPTPAPAEPAPTAAPMPLPAPAEPEPAPPAPMGNPFEGFAKSVNLPKLDLGMSEPPAESLAPLMLGPCKVDEKALIIMTLRGGEGAIRGGKQKFELAAAQDGTALRDWEIKLLGGSGPPTLVALVSVKNDQMSFQWTPEGAKQASSPLLCNCGLHLAAGTGQHDIAFRVPVVGDPLKVELEKAGATVKWNLQQLPDPKNIFIQISRLDGDFLEHKFRERDTLEGSDRTEVWTGSAADSMVLGLRFDSTVSAQAIQIKAAPVYQIKGMKTPKTLAKKELTMFGNNLSKMHGAATNQHELATKSKNEQAINLAKSTLDNVTATSAQLDELQKLIDGLDGKGAIHFRVFYQTEDGPIDLLVTEENAPASEEPAADPAAADAAK